MLVVINMYTVQSFVNFDFLMIMYTVTYSESNKMPPKGVKTVVCKCRFNDPWSIAHCPCDQDPSCWVYEDSSKPSSCSSKPVSSSQVQIATRSKRVICKCKSNDPWSCMNCPCDQDPSCWVYDDN